MQLKRLISSILVVIMLMTTMITAMPVVSNAATYEAQTVVDLANSKVGQSYTSNACLAFIKDLFKSAYGFTSTACCAYNYGSSYIDSSSRSGIPLGASVFFGGSTVICSNGHNCGHIGIYVGDDYIVHAWDGKIVKYKIDRVINYGYPYRGWGWHGNVTLTHTCNLGNYEYQLTAHPHQNCYSCSTCGKINADPNSSNYWSSCDICVGYPSKPTLTVYTGTSAEDIMFLASAADFASSYDFKVYDPSTDELVYAAYGQHRLCAMNLPAGEYYARAVGINDSLADTDRWWGTYSDAVSFTVTEGTLEPANSVEYNGHIYELYLNRLSWQNAKAKCEELGGHLATVTSAEEQEIVAALADGKGAYLGATNENGTWEWITGEEFSYINWLSGEPNNKGHLSENYLGIYTEGEWNDFDYINQNVSGFICEYDGCSHESYTATYTILPTCTEDGEEGRICNDCGEEFLIIDPAIGHNYISEMIGATCTDTAVKKYTCSNCGDIYSEEVVEEELWSDWNETYPDGVESEKIEEITQYRYSTKETKDSTTSSSLDGWEWYDSKTSYGSWSGNKTTTTKPTESDTLQIVGTSTTYNYHHWCHQSYDGIDNNIDSISYGSGGAHHYCTTTYLMSTYNMSDQGGKQAYKDTSCICSDGWWIWFLEGTTTTYTYQTRTKTVTNYFYKWSDFSDWQDEAITADDNTKVETRTVYRYLTNSPEPLGHDWSEWVLTEASCTVDGSNVRTCKRCGETESEVFVALGHNWGEWTVNDVTCTDDGYRTRTCLHCDITENEAIEAKGHKWSEWQVLKEATLTDVGVSVRYCENCTLSETKENIIAQGACGENVTWVLNDIGALVIVGQGATDDYSYNNKPWEAYKDLVKYVTVDDGVTYLGTNLFSSCSNLEKAYLPDGVTSFGFSVFSGCEEVIIVCSSASYSAQFATNNGIAFELTDTLVDVELAMSPAVTVYPINGTLMTDDIILKVINGSGKEVLFRKGYYIEEYDFSTPGEKIITIKFAGVSTSYTVTVDSSLVENKYIATGILSDTIRWRLDNDGLLEIYGDGNIGILLGAVWYNCRDQIKNVVFREGINEIGGYFLQGITNLESIVIANTTTTIDAYAFAGNTNLRSVLIPETTVNIDINAFNGCTDLTIKCYKNSYAHSYAIENNISYELIDIEPEILDVDNYTITLNNIADIKEIRFAIGHYTKGADIKVAEKNVTLDASTVKKYTDNGIFTYDLPWMGEYTFWVRYNDGSQYFIYTNIDEITPYVESYGVKLTVKDYAENYKDMWLAEGTFNSYSEIKASTAFKYQASANKLDLYSKTTHDFSYTMTNPGAYTVLIRYNDGTTDVIHTELTVDVPEFSVNGLQTTVQNIPDIKIIRTAYGHYESVGDIKKASGVRNFSNKNDIKNAEEYMIQYREAGEVTLIVEYNNGYKHFCYINIEPKSATMIQSKNTVMFDDLDGFVMIRYAKGTYTTSSQIKAAEGSKVLKPADLVGGYAIISDLEAGTYTFCVQFDDESYDYYTVVVE